MEFKKDWSLAYFLYYICQIGIWLTIINAVIMLMFNSSNYVSEDGTYFIHSIPVVLNIEGLDSLNDIETNDAKVNIYNTLKANIALQASFQDHLPAFLFYNGLKAYSTILVLVVLYFFAKVLRNVAEGNPFDITNSKYLYIIGWTLFLTSALNIFIRFLPLPLLDSISLPEGYEFSSLQGFEDFMMIGIFIIVLGYVFKEGNRIY
ncbi:MAG TPA: DUF2975 domain-containing protein, partial [Gracilimonas sp.]|uniref:DUF2975 domain-containing protein n=1 Tax=Gracilimonas sp. TaxID=1974203 RepID=UPI002DB1418A|nr:DUF2975 domain-containing protein [Gracilimonas sp.]